MKKCLIVVDLFKHIIENMQSDTTLKNDSSTINKNYLQPRIDNLKELIHILEYNEHFDNLSDRNYEFYLCIPHFLLPFLPVSKKLTWNNISTTWSSIYR